MCISQTSPGVVGQDRENIRDSVCLSLIIKFTIIFPFASHDLVYHGSSVSDNDPTTSTVGLI